MYKYSSTYRRNALLPIKFQVCPEAFVDYCHTLGGCVARVGTWFQVYTKTCIQTNIKCRRGKGSGPDLAPPAVLFAAQLRSEQCQCWMFHVRAQMFHPRKRRHDVRPSGPRPGGLEKNGCFPRIGKIILEIRIDICYTDSVPEYVGTDETLPAPRGSVSADKFVRKVSNWKTIPSIS